MSATPVLIVGSGPSGLVTALALLQNDVSVRVINKELTPRVGQRGSGIWPRILELHKLLGTLDDIEKIARPPQMRREYKLPGGTEVLREYSFVTETLDPTSAVPRPNGAMLSQELQERILRGHVEKHGCKVEFGKELVSFEQTLDDVTVVLKDVKTGETETATFKWLIGADGAHSVVRKGLGLTFLGESRASENMVVGDIHIKKGLDRLYWHSWGEPYTKAVMLRPFETEDDCFNFIINGAQLDISKIASSKEELINAIYDITERTEIEFGDLIWMSHWKPNIRIADKFGEGRAYIVGDAAHTHSPTGGQGMNSSIMDAVNIGWKLALVEKGLSSKELLNSYTTERYPVIAAMLDMTTTLLDKTFMKGGDNGAAFVRGPVLKQLGVTYRKSPIVVNSTPSADEPIDPYRSGLDGKVLAGDRAPDASAGIHDLLGTAWHTVLVFEGATADAPQVIFDTVKQVKAPMKTVLVLRRGAAASEGSEKEVDHVLRDDDGSAFENYRVGVKEGGGLVVIRPDGVVGAKVDGLEGFEKYIKSVFV